MSNRDFLNKTCISSKSRTEAWILTKLTLNVNNDKVVILVKCQGHRVKGQGQTCLHPLDLILVERNAAENTASSVFLTQT